MSDEKRIADIEKRLQAATPEPWSSMTEETPDGENIYYTVEARAESGKGSYYMLADMSDTSLQGSDDAEFIAHARQDIPWLLEKLREARGCLTDADIRRIKSEAWDEGAEAAVYDPEVRGFIDYPTNPYYQHAIDVGGLDKPSF